MIRGDEQSKATVKTILQCEIAEFPIKYLGLQLALRPLTKAQWQPALDAMLQWIPAWQRGMINRAGRLVLIKSVVSARTTHQALVAEAPDWMLEEIDRWLRAFFWTGKKNANGGQCLVAWEKVCKPLCYGGLGVKNLRLQGLALRTRWVWLQRTDRSRPWHGLSMDVDRDAEGVFRSCANLKVGDGRSSFFWKDRWIGGFTAAEIAPEVVDLIPTRRRNRRTVADALLDSSWVDDIQGQLSEAGCVQCLRLWVLVSSVHRDEAQPDRFTWAGSATGLYSAKTTYSMLCQGSIRFSMATPLWRSWAPLKCKIFGWLALQYRLWTSDRRHRHGLQDNPDSCAVCLQGEDNADHVLVRCTYARQVWFRVLIGAGLQIQEPGLESTLESWWDQARKRVASKDRRSFDSLVIATAWLIWKQRNARVFGNTRDQCDVSQLVDRIHDEFKLWRSAREGVEEPLRRE